MQCPICRQEMSLYKEEPCYDHKKAVSYWRTRYVCRTDDVWGRLEVPQKNMDRDLQDTAQQPATIPTL